MCGIISGPGLCAAQHASCVFYACKEMRAVECQRWSGPYDWRPAHQSKATGGKKLPPSVKTVESAKIQTKTHAANYGPAKSKEAMVWVEREMVGRSL